MLKKFKALIVDDEELARKDLKAVLEKFEGAEVVAEADSVATAAEAANRLRPGIIFLDIQLPGETGFDLLEKLEYTPHIIFVTAYDKYAIRAFEVNAKDYLLKPVNPERLAHTLDRFEDIPVEEDDESVRKLLYDDVIFLMINNKHKFLKINSILVISAAADYTEIHTIDGHKGITSKTMREWELRLPDNYFTRIHRSTIINIEQIQNIEEWFNYSYRVYIKGIPKPFVMSRRYAAKIKDKLG